MRGWDGSAAGSGLLTSDFVPAGACGASCVVSLADELAAAAAVGCSGVLGCGIAGPDAFAVAPCE